MSALSKLTILLFLKVICALFVVIKKAFQIRKNLENEIYMKKNVSNRTKFNYRNEKCRRVMNLLGVRPGCVIKTNCLSSFT